HLRLVDPFIGTLHLENIHMGTLQSFIAHRKRQGVKNRTVNYALQVVRHILNLAASEWLDHNGVTWLQSAPKIRLLPENDKRPPYPLSFEEQERLFDELPEHLRAMALFKVNVGCREAEVCALRWDWEIPIPELDTSVFIIPADRVKNREDRLVVLNSIAKRVIEEARGKHPVQVFTYKGRPVVKMYGEAWRKARTRAGLPQVRIHDLKHTYGRRLRAAGVSFEDRQDLLGHKSGRVTTHYSAPELINLIAASERVCARERHKSDTMVILRRQVGHLKVV
ncbi:MAG: site-specific integrase, partial [Deltaproteobacteria bacterium]|nr:site-specific integrase [Deltaproteobacteria bacterium]